MKTNTLNSGGSRKAYGYPDEVLREAQLLRAEQKLGVHRSELEHFFETGERLPNEHVQDQTEAVRERTLLVQIPEKVKRQYRVEWKCSRHPNEWKPFSRSKDYASEALYSYEECLKRPGCIAARVVERVFHTIEEQYIVPADELRGRV